MHSHTHTHTLSLSLSLSLQSGLKEVGIFRLPGKASRIQTLKEQYDAGSQEDFPPNEDIHTVASLLKLYLKELPEPVVPFALYTPCTDAMKSKYSSTEFKHFHWDC